MPRGFALVSAVVLLSGHPPALGDPNEETACGALERFIHGGMDPARPPRQDSWPPLLNVTPTPGHGGADPCANAPCHDSPFSSAAPDAQAREILGYGRTDGGMHEGRWLYNEDRSAGFRMAEIKGRSFTLEGVEGDLDDVFTDADGDGRRLYWVSDIGPGDTIRIPTATHYAR